MFRSCMVLMPSVFMNMDEQEKAFIIAAIDIKIKSEKEKQKEIERKSNKRG